MTVSRKALPEDSNLAPTHGEMVAAKRGGSLMRVIRRLSGSFQGDIREFSGSH